MRRLLVVLTVSLLTLGLLVTGSRLLGGQTRVSAAAAFDLGACVQPCWHEIQVGKTTLEQAVALLKADTARVTDVNQQSFENTATLVYWNFAPDSQRRWYGAIDIHTARVDQPIPALDLWGDGFAFGDALVLWGDPEALLVCPTNTINISPVYSPAQNATMAVSRRVWAAHAFFHGSIEVIAYGMLEPDGLRLTPQTPVSSVVYNDPAAPPYYRGNAGPWRGLAPMYPPGKTNCLAS